MPEINLPTKGTQDAIKQDTTNILGQFPISGGIDWASKSVATSSEINGSMTGYTSINITGSGYLVALNNDSNNVVNVSVQIDGGDIYNVVLTTYSSVTIYPVRFNQSLQVNAEVSNVRTWAVLD
jgi:hypothetical protein